MNDHDKELNTACASKQGFSSSGQPGGGRSLLSDTAMVLVAGCGLLVLTQVFIPKSPVAFVTPAAAASSAAQATAASGNGVMPLPAPLGGDKPSVDTSGGPAIRPPDSDEPPAAAPAGDGQQQDASSDPLAWPDKKNASPSAPSAPVSALPPVQAAQPSMPVAPPAPVSKSPVPAFAAPAMPAPVQKQAVETHPVVSPSPAGKDNHMAAHDTVKPVMPVAEASGALEGRLSALEKQVAAVQEKQASQSEVDSLKDAVNALRKDVEQLKQSAADSAKGAHKAGMSKSSAQGKKSASHAQHKKTAHQPVSAMKSTQTVKVSGQWVLKSAKPGVAWLAMPGSNELYTFSAGETLPGLGKIDSVAQDPTGHWVVSTEHGKISQ